MNFLIGGATWKILGGPILPQLTTSSDLRSIMALSPQFLWQCPHGELGILTLSTGLNNSVVIYHWLMLSCCFFGGEYVFARFFL